MPRRGTPRAAKMIGFQTGKLTVLSREGLAKGRSATWRCVCFCGNQTVATTHELKAGKRKSCGCARYDFVPKMEPIKGVDPSVAFVFKEMNKQQATQRIVAKRAGVTEHMLHGWRVGRIDPSVTRMRAVLGALGFRMKIVLEDA